MEHRRRTFSNVLDDDIIDIEKQLPRRRGTSVSIDEAIDEHIEYVYNGSFSFFHTIFGGFIKLICPCCRRNREPIAVTD
jgi:hypothetical protein